MSHGALALACNLVLHHGPARFNGLEVGVVGRCAYNRVPWCPRKVIKRLGWGWGYLLEHFHSFSLETILSPWEAILHEPCTDFSFFATRCRSRMWRQPMVRRRLIHQNQRGLRNSGKPWRTAPFAQEFMGPWAVISSRCPCTFTPQCGGGSPAVLRHRLHTNEPLAFPCGFWHPRPISLPVPEKSLLWFLFI
jgi:hypothetical protein